MRSGDQEGGVEGRGAHFPSQTHWKHIYVWNNSHRKATENWQISYTTKAARKIPLPLGRTKKKKKKKNHQDRTSTPGRDLWKRKCSLDLGTPIASWGGASPGTDRELERTVFCSQECAGAGLLTIRTERDGHWWLSVAVLSSWKPKLDGAAGMHSI